MVFGRPASPVRPASTRYPRLADRDGSFIPFARIREERETAGDPRPSLAERHGSRAAYLAKVKAAAEALVAEHLLSRNRKTAKGKRLLPLISKAGGGMALPYRLR